MSPSPTARHQLIAGNLVELFRTAVRNVNCGCLVLFETDWQVDDSTVVCPDISILYGGLPEQFIDYPPSLIVEVLSPSTAKKDRTAKRELYASQHVAVYIIVDPETQTIDVLELNGDDYSEKRVSDSVEVAWKDGCRVLASRNAIFSGTD